MISASRTLLVATILALLAPAAAARAATFTVNASGDQTDAAPGNGVCATAGGQCTLRAAIIEANGLMGADTITVPAGTYDVGSSLPLSSTVTITGAGARDVTVRATTGTVMQVTGSAVVTGLTITGGTTGMSVSGATAEATLDRVAIRGNAVTTAASISGVGLRVDASAKVLIRRSAITGNTGVSTASGNAYGAGIYAANSQLDIRSTTIADNALTGNSQVRGGGILAFSSSVSLRHVTLSGNAVNSGFGDRYGGNLYVTGIAPTVTDSILTGGVANAGHENCSTAAGALLPITSGRNIDSGTSCGFGAGQLPSTNPQLEALANAGGHTDARVPKRTSPAVDQAGTCPDHAVDQRGAAAPSGGACDIGATELSANLGVALAQSSTATTPGADVTFVATITNTGFDAAEAATLDMAASGASAVPLVVPSAGTCPTTTRCELGTIPAGGRVAVTVVLRAAAAGALTATAAVSAATPQSTTADDAATASVPVQGSPGGGTQPPATAAVPVLGAVRLVGTARAGRPIRLASTLSGDATLAVRIERLVSGRRAGSRCSTKARRGTRCTIVRLAGRHTHRGQAGAVRVTLPRRFGTRTLTPGRYRVTVQATGADGLRSPARILTIRVVA